ncbi:NAD-dependent epimerase/dehydratase family protein [Rossellomorea marisflavi]|uniref:NAD-dependent epimerase/dehydratase family protein n=1 Tax=Rossellomorea marisflavi TaxID=189381 RepID=UPI0034593B64
MLLITGITGHTGGFFLKELIKQNYEHPIKCIVRENSNTTLLDNSPLNIQKITGDIRDVDFLNECMEGVTTVFHIVNIRHTIPILKTAINHNVDRFISVHTTGIYSNFRKASEEYIQIENKIKVLTSTSKVKVTIIRPTMIFGDLHDRNMSRFIKMIDRYKVFPVIGGGKSLIQPVNARDLGKAYFQILSLNSSQVRFEYILSGDKPITMKEAFNYIGRFLNKKTLYINVPAWLGVGGAKFAYWISLRRINYIEQVQRMTESRAFSHELAKLDFGYKPESFELGIKREVTEFIEKG